MDRKYLEEAEKIVMAAWLHEEEQLTADMYIEKPSMLQRIVSMGLATVIKDVAAALDALSTKHKEDVRKLREAVKVGMTGFSQAGVALSAFDSALKDLGIEL